MDKNLEELKTNQYEPENWYDYDYESILIANEISGKANNYKHEKWQAAYDAARKIKFSYEIMFFKEPENIKSNG